MRIESIKDYINVLDNNKLMDLANEIYKIIDFVKIDYPNHENWFFTKHLPEALHSDKRNILFIKDKEKVIGVANLLKDENEKKICTLYIKSEYQHKGLGSMLVEESMKWLDTRFPIISFTKERYDIYKPIIEKYNWKLTRKLNGFYKDGIEELFFNVPEDNTIYK